MDTLSKIDKTWNKTVGYRLIVLLMVAGCGDGHTIKRRAAPENVAFFCPMDTLVNAAVPGKCPECKMKLRKNPAYQGSERDSFVITTMGDTVSGK